jgi:heme oxygenase
MNFQEKLKEQTKELHDKSENHVFHTRLLDGSLPDLKYFVYLHNMFPIVSYIERRMNLNGELIRSPLMHNDIMRYSKNGCVIEGKDFHYFDWVSQIGITNDKWLPAILYVEWLKDAYGGQIIAPKVKFNSALKFNDAKNVISSVRSYLQEIKPEDENTFIHEVNKVYENHIILLDKIMSV